MKTPEQLAVEWLKEEYGDTSNWTYMGQEMSLDAFYAGYQAAQQWISVKERLPEVGQVVLVAMPKGTVTLGGIRKKTQAWDVFLDMAICTAEPTHWMPLPKLPKEEEK